MTQITIPSLGPIGTVSPSSFHQKLISTTIAIGPSNAGSQPSGFSSQSGSSTITISDARTSARITHATGLYQLSLAEVSIFGLSQSLMNELQTLGIFVNMLRRNRLTLAAGDAISGLSTVFTGDITHAVGDYNAAPEVAMRFACQAGASDQVVPLPATTFSGATDVITVMSQIALAAGWGFLNNGVPTGTIMLSNPYYPGSPVEQARRAADHAHINWQLVPGTTTPVAGGGQPQPYVLAIWPRNGSRPGPSIIPVISKDTGMIGYPSFETNGIMCVKTLFNPSLVLGGQINVQSSIFTNQSLAAISNPSSIWNVWEINHALDSLVPNGDWVSTLYCQVSNPAFPALPPAGPL